MATGPDITGEILSPQRPFQGLAIKSQDKESLSGDFRDWPPGAPNHWLPFGVLGGHSPKKAPSLTGCVYVYVCVWQDMKARHMTSEGWPTSDLSAVWVPIWPNHVHWSHSRALGSDVALHC